MVGLHVIEYFTSGWIWGFPWGFQWDSCGYGMGMGIEMPSPRQPWQIFIQISPTLTKLCHTKRDHLAKFYISLEL